MIWRKSSRSNATQANCVEIARSAETVAVRDSKNTCGPMVVVPVAGWATFLRSRL